MAHSSPTATAYATSLLELANEGGITEPIGAELADVRQILSDNKTFQLFLEDPTIGTVERTETLKRIFDGKINQLLLNFLGLLGEKGRLGILGEIADAFHDLLDEQLGKIEVDVTVAHKLTPEQLEEVRQKVSSALKKDAVVHQYIDPSIIGGLILRVQDRMIDASVRSQLNTLKQQLLASRRK